MGMKEEQPDYQKQFEAAVRVIQSLPKSGSYRPTYEEMLRFYSYYKQATVGQCHIPRPGFWDPIGRYKWDAWNRLGKMTKEEAMTAYIAEMKNAAQKVINTVPMDETSEDMFAYFEPLYEVIHDMPRPPESFFKKKPGQGGSESACLQHGTLNGLAESCPDPPACSEHKEADHADKAIKNSYVTSDAESEVFCDSLEHVELEQAKRPTAKGNLPLKNPHRVQPGEKSQHVPSVSGKEGKPNKALQTDPDDSPSHEVSSEGPADTLTQQDVDQQVMNTIQALQEDMKKVMERLSYLESWVALQGNTSMPNPSQPIFQRNRKDIPGWPVHLSPSTWFFLLAWPFIVQWLLWCFQRQKR